MIETRRRDTGEVVVIRRAEKCCNTCRHYSAWPEGSGLCDLLVDWHRDSEADEWKPYQIWAYQCNKTRLVDSHPVVGDGNVCNAWEDYNV